MAIQLRRGIFDRFDPTKLLPGEVAVVTSGDPSTADGRSVYICFSAGNVKRLIAYEDIAKEIANALEDLEDDFADAVREATESASAAAASANSAASAASSAAERANVVVASVPELVEQLLEDHPEWTTTVQDGAISRAKLASDLTNPLDRLMYRLSNMLTATLAEAESVTVADAAQTPMAGLTLYGRSTQDGTPTPDAPVAIQSVEAANLLDVTATGQTIRGVEYTVDGGVVTANGTASGGNATLTLGTMSLSAGTYALSGITGGSGTTYALRVYKVSGNATIKYVYNADTFALDADAEVGVQAYVYDGTTVSGLTLTPMLVHGSVPMHYVPYGCVGLLVLAKNLLPNNGSSATSYGVTFTVNEDGSVTCSGTATGQARFDIGRDITPLSAGTYVCGEGTGSGYNIDVYKVVDGTATRIRSGFGTFTLDAETSVFVRIVVASGATVSATISPYIYRGTTATAYEPCTDTVMPIPIDGHALRSLPDGTRDEVTVDERGHAVLVQRVGSVTLDGSIAPTGATAASAYFNISTLGILPPVLTTRGSMGYCNRYEVNSNFIASAPVDMRVVINATAFSATPRITFYDSTHVGSFATWLTLNPVTVLYQLATPVTHDLGYVDPIPLVGPDLTARPIPDTTMALTYERDLDTTLARLEAAIAALA